MPALAEHPRTVGILELDKMVVLDFAVLLADAHLPPPLPLGADGIRPLDPVDDIEVVYVLLTDVIAREPVEVVPVPDLVLHFGHAGLAVARPHAAAVPVGAGGVNVADGAILQSLDRF